MSRRHLRIISSSSSDDDGDDDDNDNEPQRQPLDIDIENDENQNPNNNNIEMEILESTTNLQSITLNSPPQNPRSLNSNPQPVINAADCGIGRVLGGLGLGLRKEWLESCVRGLEGTVGEFTRLDDVAKAKLCFEQFLYSDMNYCGAGMLPKDVHKLHLVDLKGPFVLQVDEIVNISCPLRGRYQKAAAGIKRCLKLSMTDGIQRVFGMEYRPIKDLDVLAPSGLKVAICNVHVRHGLLMLVPEVIEVLGGMVEELEGARQRLVNEINKPPRGKRTRTGEVPSLTARATYAAWPPEGVSAPERADTSTRESSMPSEVHEQGTASRVATAERQEIHPIHRGNDEPDLPSAATMNTPVYRRESKPNFPSTAAASIPLNMKDTRPSLSSNAARHVENIHMVDMTTEEIDTPIGRQHNEPIRLSSSTMEVEELLSDGTNGPATPASGRSTESAVSTSRIHIEDVEPESLSTAAIDNAESGLPSDVTITRPVYKGGVKPNFPSTAVASVPLNLKDTGPSFASDAAGHAENISMFDDIGGEYNEPILLSTSTMEVEESLSYVSNGPATPASGRSTESIPVSISRLHNENADPESLSTAATDVEEIDLVDELEHPFILSGEKEKPFSYLASLFAKQAGMEGSASTVTGKVKCILTGVKSFQYKQRSKYELRAYVDDGSLISEILIDHDVVQKEIGYSPAEATTALEASDGKIVDDMKETMKRFQKFLANFEGTMLIQMNEESSVPVAIEMNQGCPASDACLLLKRLKSSTSSRSHQHLHPETINLSA